jgi:uncharacterized protein YdeI (BOF family)
MWPFGERSEMSEMIYNGCIGNGAKREVFVFREASGEIRIEIAAGGNYAEIFRGSIEAARSYWKKMKKGKA